MHFYCSYRRKSREEQRLDEQLKANARKILDNLSLVKLDNVDGEDETCSICLNDMKKDDNVRKLDCGHIFHPLCVDPWLLDHRCCPLCNYNILTIRQVPTVSANTTASNTNQQVAVGSINPTFRHDENTPL
ncbi:unnamed protein product [Didymodactylos carnosus]|uniref:RING-type domain-containing protein n=1 Tax=Didymodactylos carnosus TaxID=1234261 RepID=A0A815A4X2_9BILA|nr:unnamed protein product [Didymodactylos carnosus]CAF4020780.1 unnamed protein product [Didymodactylos carnosus]